VKTFLHGGDFGDVIYALPAIRALGGGVLYLSETHPGREPLTAARRDVLIPLLERIDYLEAVRVHQGESVDVDFTGFRKHLRPGEVNLAQAQLAGCGLPLDLADDAWIDRPALREPGVRFALVIHRTERYRNPLFPWETVVEKFGRRASFVGLTREYLDFVSQHGSVFFRPTKNLLEMAELIADCRIFIGNQSVGYALAEAMKVDSVLEAYPDFLDCMFSRENIIQVAGGRLDLDWITSRLSPSDDAD
jgi:hypothetical protein